MNKYFGLLVFSLCLILSACSQGTQSDSRGDPEAGKTLFQQGPGREAPACSSCHSTEVGKVIIGPSLAGVASRAAERKSGISADDYLRESILDPNAYIVEGFRKGVMYQKFGDVLTDEDLDNLIAYLLTLK
jgi:nitric oxide reductase subunit C